jgi:LuxR family maltose regulon positive regulatory protein
VAWLSLDPGDKDPIRFWRYVAEALDRVQAGIGQRVAATLHGPPAPLDAVVTVVINELASQAGRVVLVVDDYHLIEAQPVHGAVGALLERQPDQLRLVITTRADPPLPLARLRARGQLAELPPPPPTCASPWRSRPRCCGRPPAWSCRPTARRR